MQHVRVVQIGMDQPAVGGGVAGEVVGQACRLLDQAPRQRRGVGQIA